MKNNRGKSEKYLDSTVKITKIDSKDYLKNKKNKKESVQKIGTGICLKKQTKFKRKIIQKT